MVAESPGGSLGIVTGGQMNVKVQGYLQATSYKLQAPNLVLSLVRITMDETRGGTSLARQDDDDDNTCSPRCK